MANANVPGRLHIAKVEAKNFRVVKRVDLSVSDGITRIAGDAGQGKTTVLDIIAVAMEGGGPDCISTGETVAEIHVDMESMGVSRYITLKGDTVKLSGDGVPTEGQRTMKKYLAELFGSAAFRPLQFVKLGAVTGAGQTVALREQRKQLLDALPLRMSPTEYSAYVGMLSAEARALLDKVKVQVDLDSDHALTICSRILAGAVDLRKKANSAVDDKTRELESLPAPEGVRPDGTVEALKKDVSDTQTTWENLKAEANVRDRSLQRIDVLTSEVCDDEEALNIKSQKAPNFAELRLARKNGLEQVEQAEGMVASLEKKLREAREKEVAARESLRSCDEAVQVAKQYEAEMFQDKALMESKQDELAGLSRDVEKVLDDAGAAHGVYQSACGALLLAQALDARSVCIDELEGLKATQEAWTEIVDAFRNGIPRRLMAKADIGIEDLSLSGDVITVRGHALHRLGTSEQLVIAVKLALHLSPCAGFVCVDGAESLGKKERKVLAELVEERGIQLFMTEVDPAAVPGAGTVVMKDGAVVKE